MEQNRREFLTGAAWKGLCDSDRFDFSKGVTKDKDAQRT